MNIRKIIDRVLDLFLYGCGVFVLLLLLQVFCFTSFKIPSDSMEPSLLSGDRILVSKFALGARLFDVFAILRSESVSIHRIPGLGAINRNDVLVFNFPYPVRWDSIGFDVMRYYVKRCIALPGDTIEIRNGFYQIGGVGEELGNRQVQKILSSLSDSTVRKQGVVFDTFPWSGKLGWTIKEFGPLPVPSKGQLVKLDDTAWLLYRQLVGWEQKKWLELRGDTVLLGDSIVTEYRFQENYYFVSGDKMLNSQDSRYWGLLPEAYIVGKALWVWKSIDPGTGKIRWKRVFKKII